jgi:hypothetical protein
MHPERPALVMPQRYEDVSNWGEPYDSHIFDGFYMGGLGADAETPAPPTTPGTVVIPEVTVYGQCDFTTGPYVAGVQKFLVDKKALSPADAATEVGQFGEATCAAWKEHFGAPPSAATLASGFLKPGDTCGSLVLPGCAAEQASVFSPTKLLLYGAGLVGILYVAKAIGRK